MKMSRHHVAPAAGSAGFSRQAGTKPSPPPGRDELNLAKSKGSVYTMARRTGRMRPRRGVEDL